MAAARVAAGAAFSPASLSGLQAWYKADGLALADNAAVATWPDSSGNSRNATQATGGNQPTYKTGIVAGRPVVRFDGTDDWIASAAFGPFSQPTNIVVATKLDGGGVLVDGIGANRNIVLNNSGSMELYAGAFVGGTAESLTWQVLATRFDGASTVYRRNGTAITAGNPSTLACGGVTMGSWVGGVGNFLFGDIAEVLIYNPALSAGNLLLVEQHLGAKYGITIA